MSVALENRLEVLRSQPQFRAETVNRFARFLETAPEESAQRSEAFRRIEEGIAALRRGGRAALPAERTPPARGSLRFRQQAAREVRVSAAAGEASQATPAQDKSKPS